MKHDVFDIPSFKQRDEDRVRAVAYREGMKRALDVFGVLVLSPIVVPLVAVLYVLVRLDGGAGFFGHARVGLNGKEFRCWKLRTMVPDAHQALRSHLASDPAAMREWLETYKLRNDPRVTRLGRILRKTSLDELPQFWNVLRGEMSLVGPRPVPEAELAEYRGSERAYFLYRPGITGLWQVSGRNDVSYAARVSLDESYASRAGLLLDLVILFKTVGVVLKRSGV